MNIDDITVGELLEKLEQISKAAEALQKLQAIMGGQPVQPYAPLATPPDTTPLPPPTTNKGPVAWTPAELAQKEALLREATQRKMTPEEEAAMQARRNSAAGPLEGLRR